MCATKVDWLYTDSGHPGVDNYSTVILIHGMNWHGESFERMYKLAAPAGLRLVALNRRGYPGTTPYSAAEMALLTSSDPEQHALFQRQQGLAIARAVLQILADPALALPAGGKLGVLGWSTGNWFVVALLSVINDPDLLPAEREKLGAALHHPILLEPPTSHMGGELPDDPYFPIPGIATEQQVMHWATGYYDHGAALAARDRNALNLREHSQNPPPLSDRLEPAKLASLTTDASTWDGPFLGPAWKAANERATRDALTKVRDGLWPHVKRVSVIWGDRTFWLIPPGVWALETYVKELGGPELDIKQVKGGNHFIILDHPEETTAFLKEIMAG